MANLLQTSCYSGKKEAVDMFKSYVQGKGMVIGNEVAKALALYMKWREHVDVAEAESQRQPFYISPPASKKKDEQSKDKTQKP